MLAGLVVGIIGIEAGIEVWFRSAEQQAASGQHWSAQWPIEEREYRETAISEKIHDTLRYDEGRNISWKEANGRPWQMYYLRWMPAESRYRAVQAASQSRVHAPEVCLSAAGMTLLKDSGTQVRQINGVALRTQTQRFLDQGRNLHLTTCYWDPDPRMLQFEMTAHPSTLTCLRMAIQSLQTHDRMRNEKRVLKIGVWGLETDEEAEESFRQLLGKLILSAKTP